MKIINHEKFLISITMALTLIISGILFFSNIVFSFGEKQYISLYVDSGDTLWNISKNQQNTNSYYEGKDIRYIVGDIKSINHLSNSDLVVGQELIIPVI